MARVSEEEVLLVWRALVAFRSGPRPACGAKGNSPGNITGQYVGCPRLPEVRLGCRIWDSGVAGYPGMSAAEGLAALAPAITRG